MNAGECRWMQVNAGECRWLQVNATFIHYDCWRGGWLDGCQSRHIRINPMFNCIVFVKVCDFAEIKSIQKKM